MKVNFWDVAGDPIYLQVRNEFYKDTHGAVLVYDVSSGKSFDALDKWVKELRELAGEDVIVILAGNKVRPRSGPTGYEAKKFIFARPS